MSAGASVLCPGCSAELPAALLACPSCRQLVHAPALKQLAEVAERSERDGDLARALTSWRRALELLPEGALQRERIRARVQTLNAQVAAAPPETHVAAATTPSQAEPQKSGRKWFVGLGALGVALAKFKWLLIPVLTKGKLLLLGLAQAKTFFSMALALGVYSTAYGWQFALGLVVSIYIHEMGHVAWLRHYGIAASAPMFIPGVGAFVRLHSNPADVGEDARIGLAGPVWGAGAVVAAVVLQMIFAEPIFGAIAHAGAFINLFNLLPVWQLDGGRAFRALTRGQRAIAAATLWLLAVIVGDGLLFVLAAAATLRAAMQAGAPEKRDDGVLATYLALAVGLTLLMLRSKLP